MIKIHQLPPVMRLLPVLLAMGSGILAFFFILSRLLIQKPKQAEVIVGAPAAITPPVAAGDSAASH
jgi:hypothetical protein